MMMHIKICVIVSQIIIKTEIIDLAISAIFVAYRFVLASDIKTMTEENSTVEKGVPNRKNVLLNGILVKDNSGQAVVVDFSNPSQVLFRRP